MEKSPKDMNELLKFIEEAGYEIKRGKNIAVRSGEQKSFIRFRSLGEGYRESDFEKIFAGEAKHEPNPHQKTQPHRYRKPEQ